MNSIKYPTDYLKRRRKEVGLTQQQVADSIGMNIHAYEVTEERGGMPEKHFQALSRVLNVPVVVLHIEKQAAVVEKVFCIPKGVFRTFARNKVGSGSVPRRSGSSPKVLAPKTNERAMPESHRRVLDRVRKMTPKQGFASLVMSGIYTPQGELTPEYGGPKR